MPPAAAKIAFAIGAHYADREDWREAQKRLSSGMKLIDKSATFDVQVQAHAVRCGSPQREPCHAILSVYVALALALD